MDRKTRVLFSLQLLSETFLILRRIRRDINIHRLFLTDFHETWIFFDRFFENTQLSNAMKIRPVGATCSTRTDGQTDRQTLRR